MKIYADTSFLISWLYGKDKNHKLARDWFGRYEFDDWIISAWSEFETVNRLRGLCLAEKGPKSEVIESIRRFFKHLLANGILKRQPVSWLRVMANAHEISSLFAAEQKARSADILHVAILEQLQPDIFISGDADQVSLGAATGFESVNFLSPTSQAEIL